MSTEAALISAAVALYLADCIVLLERGQALWTKSALSFGSLHYQVRGRAVALLNPLAPFLPVMRTLPLFAAASGVDAEAARRAFAPLSFLGLLQFALVLIALPFCLVRAPGWPFFAALLVAYLNAVALLALIYWRLRGAQIATRPLIGLGFGWLVCLPLSVNALRTAGLAFDVAIDAREAIARLPEPARERARAGLAAQIGEAMQELDESDELRLRLGELHRELLAAARQ